MSWRKTHLRTPPLFAAAAFVVTSTLATLTVTDVVGFWVFAIATTVIFISNLIRYWATERAMRDSDDNDR